VTPKAPSADYVREFAASMGRAYRREHDEATIAEHAGVASRRADRAANVEVVSSIRHELTSLCVVADDRPGLLATISAAFVLSGVDVMDAEAHTRRTSGGRLEAVDVFWVRQTDEARRAESVTAEQASEVERVLVELLAGTLDAREAAAPPSAPALETAETVVRFLENGEGDLATFEVETDDRSGLLLALSRALFDARVQIVESEVKTVERRVFDRFHICELDGSPISPARRLEIQVAVLSAIQPVAPKARARAQRANGREAG
jgi:[protein-PII] uridylyltransferase